MFSILSNLTKAAVGVAIETPIAMVADVVTMGGELTDKRHTYTGEAIGRVMDNINKQQRAKIRRLLRSLFYGHVMEEESKKIELLALLGKWGVKITEMNSVEINVNESQYVDVNVSYSIRSQNKKQECPIRRHILI